jgi:hypothetical protein
MARLEVRSRRMLLQATIVVAILLISAQVN